MPGCLFDHSSGRQFRSDCSSLSPNAASWELSTPMHSLASCPRASVGICDQSARCRLDGTYSIPADRAAFSADSNRSRPLSPSASRMSGASSSQHTT